jgi:peptidoglycan/xylan/chitin deacetylase (PgdA/CDA1 family)
MKPPKATEQQRFVSITFDDGLLTGTRIAVELLAKHGGKASFYIVTGWVKPERVRIRDAYNVGRDHGTWADWQHFDALGHEIGSHTASHLRADGIMARLRPSLLLRELSGSFDDLQRNLRKPPISIAMPYDAVTGAFTRIASQYYQAARMGCRAIVHIDPEEADWYRLPSWAPRPGTPIEEICRGITDIPTSHWLILQFHSLGNEGWNPVSPEAFERLLRAISESDNLRLVTIREMVNLYKASHSSVANV